jgi:hypothetical protein|tara:strand:- start:191 stop:478 length:288 start_codon:yes stop_codon:yes gene_type:complete
MKETLINLETGEQIVQDMSAEMVAEIENYKTNIAPVEAMKDIRRIRNLKLQETDYMVLSDTSGITDAWKTYRQALRDLPANTSDLANPTWPTKPS